MQLIAKAAVVVVLLSGALAVAAYLAHQLLADRGGGWPFSAACSSR